MKYAIVEDGGKQYKAVLGATIEVDRYDAEVGDEMDLEHVLLVSDGDDVMVGTPTVKGAKVLATVVDQILGPKIIVFKYKRRKRYRRKQGHRQPYTAIRIDGIDMS